MGKVQGWREAADDLSRHGLAPLGKALGDYRRGERDAAVRVHIAGEPSETLRMSYFFRTPSRMGIIDRAALAETRGRVLDVGAGVGAHALPLQRRGHDVTALELLPEAVRVLESRGLADVREGSLWSFQPGDRYQTVLALMNGTALAGTLGGLEPLLGSLRRLVARDGRLLLDSTRVGDECQEEEGSDPEKCGSCELHYQLEYRDERGPPFPQLFVHPRLLAAIAAGCGWRCEVIARQGRRYLARMRPA